MSATVLRWPLLLLVLLVGVGQAWTPTLAPSARAATPAVMPTRLGVLLPLTGKFAPAGLAVKKGLELAFEQQPSLPYGDVELFFRDTQDSPALTSSAMESLVYQDKVVAIIGPLVSATADAAAETAGKLQVPLLALTQKSGLPNLGSQVFRLFMTPEAQIRALVAYAMENLSLSRFAIAYPEQKYGMELAALFWDEVARRGGQVTGVEGYPVGTADFLNVARRLGGKYYVELRKKEFQKGEAEYLRAFREAGRKPPRPYELPPIVDYDGLFIPDGYKTASLLASTLAFVDVPVGGFTVSRSQTPVRLLGSSAWNNPDLTLQGGQYVEGAAFVDTFFAQSPEPHVQEFVSSFRRAHQKTPDMLAAVGYDAYRLLYALLEGRPTDRAGLVKRLQTMAPFQGVTGSLAFDTTGEPRRELLVISVYDKQLKQVKPVVEDVTGLPSPQEESFPMVIEPATPLPAVRPGGGRP